MSPADGVGRPRASRIVRPAIVTAIETITDSSAPAIANASIFAARNRNRAGAARSELVIVRWRHSPVIPTIARTVMNSALVSE